MIAHGSASPGGTTIEQLLHLCTTRFNGAGLARPQQEAELLLMHLLGLGRPQLILQAGQPVEDAVARQVLTAVDRRCNREPIQYIIGSVEFWSLDFLVGPQVLIPRPETEFVCEMALAAMRNSAGPWQRLLDMGTGSGVIATVMARELGCRVLAVDSSPRALDVARTNFHRFGLGERIMVLCSDLFSAIREGTLVDAIISNPPYVADRERPDLDPEVRDFEPEQALFAGSDGLDCYRRLIPESVRFLRSGGWLILEIGCHQGEPVAAMMKQAGFRQIDIRRDYAKRPRCVRGRKP